MTTWQLIWRLGALITALCVTSGVSVAAFTALVARQFDAAERHFTLALVLLLVITDAMARDVTALKAKEQGEKLP